MKGLTNSNGGFVAKQIGEILQQDRSKDDTFLLCDGSLYDCTAYIELSSYFPISNLSSTYEPLDLDLYEDATNFSVFYNETDEIYYIFYRAENNIGTVSKTKDFIKYESANSNYIPNYYINNVFLYIGGNTIYSSINGQTWTLRLNTTTDHIQSYMAYDGSECYIMTTTQGHYLVPYTSANGINWVRRETGQQYNTVYGCWYCNNNYYFSDAFGTLYESSNGLKYSERSFLPQFGYLTGMDYGNGIYMVQVETDDYYSYILTSTDLETWTQRRRGYNTTPPYIYPTGLVFYEGIWFIQDNDTNQIVKYSLNDGKNWSNLTTDFKNSIVDFWITKYYTFYSDTNYPTPTTPYIRKSGSFQFRVPNYNSIAYIKSKIK